MLHECLLILSFFWYNINLFLSIELICSKYLSWLEENLSSFICQILLNIWILGICEVLEESIKIDQKVVPILKELTVSKGRIHLATALPVTQSRLCFVYVYREPLPRLGRKWVVSQSSVCVFDFIWLILFWETAQSFTLLRSLTYI